MMVRIVAATEFLPLRNDIDSWLCLQKALLPLIQIFEPLFRIRESPSDVAADSESNFRIAGLHRLRDRGVPSG